MYVYKGDINEVAFGAELDSLRTRYHDLNSVILCDIVKVFQDMKPTSRLLFSEVVTVLKRVLVMSATNATSERSFSALRRLKTFLRSTMTQGRLTHWMILHVHWYYELGDYGKWVCQWYGTPSFHFRQVLNDRAFISRQSMHIHGITYVWITVNIYNCVCYRNRKHEINMK